MSGFYVKHIRNDTSTSVQNLCYDNGSGEIVYRPLPTGTIPRGTGYESYLCYGSNQWVMGSDNISIGTNAGSVQQYRYSVALGYGAGQTRPCLPGINFGGGAVAIGYQAGNSGQIELAVAIGYQAGYSGQGYGAVTIGNLAGNSVQVNLSQ